MKSKFTIQFFKVLLIILLTTTTTWAAETKSNDSEKERVEADKNAAIDRMDEKLDNFDNQTDEEALQELKEKTKKKKEENKKDEVSKEENKVDTQNSELKDTNIKTAGNTKENTQENTDEFIPKNSQQFENADDTPSKREFKLMLTLGGGFTSTTIDYHASRHFGGEFITYLVPREGRFLSGISLGAGVVKLDSSELYVSVAYSGMFLPMSSDWGPFIRFDIGGLLWNNDIIKSDEEIERDGESRTRYIGLLLKGGGGFLLGNQKTGVSVHLLYTIHTTTMGTNDGIELQVGFHF